MFEIVIDDRYEPRTIRNFNFFTLTLAHDSSCSTFGVQWLFDPNDYDHKEMITPSHFHPISVKYNGELLVYGNMINFSSESKSTSQLITLGGYSRTGVLGDSMVPISQYPLQTKGLSLKAIAEKLTQPYNIKVKIDPSVASAMQSANTVDNIQPTESIQSYLQKITEVKRVIMSHTPEGELLFTSAKTEQQPIRHFDNTQGSFPAYGFKFGFDGEKMHRYITVMQQATKEGTNGGQHTIRNPYVVLNYVKDKTVTLGAGIADDVASAARQELGKELANITLSIDVFDWKLGDELIKPNSIISVFDPNLYIYKTVNWFVKSVSYTGDHTGIKCTLECCLPEVFNNKDVQSIFGNINVHPNKTHNHH